MFFTADTHFNHENIMRYAKRPFHSIREHDEKLIENWNSLVSKKDDVYVLGDFAWRNHLKYIMALNGKKHLILGNHDRMGRDVYRNFTEVCFMKELKIGGQKIFLSHYPHKSWNGSCHDRLHLYGHCHGRMKEDGLSFDVGVDVWDYKPISIETVLKKYEWLKKVNKYHLEEEITLVDNSMWISRRIK